MTYDLFLRILQLLKSLLQLVMREIATSIIVLFFLFEKICSNYNGRVCYTHQCIETGKLILNSINPQASPCHNFYDYACGKWNNSIIPDSSKHVDQFVLLQRKVTNVIEGLLEDRKSSQNDSYLLQTAKSLYSSCIIAGSSQNVKILHEFITSFGDWQLFTGKSTYVTKTLTMLHSTFSIGFLFTIGIWRSANENRIYVTTPEFEIHSTYLANGNIFKRQFSAYKIFVHNVLKEYHNLISRIKPMNVFQPAKVDQLINFEIQLASIVESKNDVQFIEESLMEIHRSNFNNGFINFYQIITQVFRNHGVQILNKEIILYDKTFLGRLFQLIRSSTIETISNYIHYKLLLHLIAHNPVPNSLRKIHFTMRQAIYGLAADDSISKTCTLFVSSSFGHVLGDKYVEKVVGSEDIQSKTKDILKNVWQSLRFNIGVSNLLPQALKNMLIQRTNELIKCGGSPTGLKLKLNQLYSGLDLIKLNSNPEYFGKFLIISRWSRGVELGRYNVPFVKSCPLFLPQSVYASYINRRSAIEIPSGLLQPPFFHSDQTAAVNYGGLGRVVAHEIAHSIDNNNFNSTWMQFSDKFDIRQKIQCFSNRYVKLILQSEYASTFTIIQPKFEVSEIFADHLGLWMAFDAFKNLPEYQKSTVVKGLENYTPEQIFFLSVAVTQCETWRPESLIEALSINQHVPKQIGVIETLQNFREFKSAWNCQINSKARDIMPERCNLF